MAIDDPHGDSISPEQRKHTLLSIVLIVLLILTVVVVRRSIHSSRHHHNLSGAKAVEKNKVTYAP